MQRRRQRAAPGRMLSTREAADYMGLGINSTRTLANDIGATVKVGKRLLIDRYKLDDFIDKQTHMESNRKG